jgi:CHAT domain
MMAWLAEKSSLIDEVGQFEFGSDPTFHLELKFSPPDVWLDQQSIFEKESDWRAITGLVAREIGLSVGSENLRNHWRAALTKRTAQDFNAGKFFTTLKTLHDDFRTLKEAPVKLTRSSPSLIEILVRIDTENKELTFELNGLGYLHKPVGTVPLLTVSESELRAAELSKLARTELSRILEPDVDDPKLLVPSVGKLEAEGVELWSKFIPEELRQAYSDLRDRDLTIFIISEDPSFPWELVRPFALKDKKNPGFEDLWWAVKFSIARWLSGFHAPADDFALKRICCVADQNLQAATRERNYLQSIATVCHLPQTFDELRTLLETNDYDVIHFACHGRFATDNPGESVALLPDGYRLTPTDLSKPAIMQKFADNRPLVFLNSCHSGRTGNTLLGIEGWARKFIDLKCGGFIGSGWEVTDKLAADFAISFYGELQRGQSLGKAVHLARGEVKEQAEKNSTWLAYYLYGNPNAILR